MCFWSKYYYIRFKNSWIIKFCHLKLRVLGNREVGMRVESVGSKPDILSDSDNCLENASKPTRGNILLDPTIILKIAHYPTRYPTKERKIDPTHC